MLIQGLVLGSVAMAGPPQVQFDVVDAVGFRNVTSPEFAAVNPGERLLAGMIPISALFRDGDGRELLQFIYRFESPERSVQIADYWPKTALTTDIVGPVGVEEKQEATTSLGIDATALQACLVQGAVHGDVATKANASRKYEQLPRMQLLSASGTVDRGRGVYFKLRPSPQSSLEGAKEFTLILRVPADWKADYLHVHCLAVGLERSVLPPTEQQVEYGRASFVLAIYVEGDRQAKAAADELARAEWRLRTMAASRQREIQRRQYPTPAHKLAALLELADPKLPPSWMEQIIAGAPPAEAAEYLQQLPPDLRLAAAGYQQAKSRLKELSGSAVGR